MHGGDLSCNFLLTGPTDRPADFDQPRDRRPCHPTQSLLTTTLLPRNSSLALEGTDAADAADARAAHDIACSI